MSYSKGIIYTFRRFGKSADSTIFSVGMKNIPSAGKDFVTVGLVTHIPDNLVIGCIENMVQGPR